MTARAIIFAFLTSSLVSLNPAICPAQSAENPVPTTTARTALPPLPQLPPSVVRIPLTRQATDYTCGAGALQGVLGYYGEDINEGDLAKPLKSNSKIGTRYQEMIKYARAKGYEVTVYKDATISKLQALLDDKLPVIVLLQAWCEKKTDYSKDWDDGHYAVAIGYDKQNIYFMDPSTLGHYTYIPVEEFESRWHDKDSKETLVHFAMTVSKPKPNYMPEQVTHME